MQILYKTIHQVSTRQCKKYWAVAATIFYRIGYIKISNGRQYVTTSARRFHFTVLLKFRLETQLLLNLILGEMCRVTICESLGLIINLLDLWSHTYRPIPIFYHNTIVANFSARKASYLGWQYLSKLRKQLRILNRT